MTTQEKIAVMQAFVEGKSIQIKIRGTDEWIDYNGEKCEPALIWDWDTYIYRIKTELPKTWEEFCKTHPVKNGESYITSTSRIRIEEYEEGNMRHSIFDRRILPNAQVAEAVLALCQLIQLRDCYNDGWQPDWSCDEDRKYTIENFSEELYKSISCTSGRVLAFKTEELCDKFFENFYDLIEQAKELI